MTSIASAWRVTVALACLAGCGPAPHVAAVPADPLLAGARAAVASLPYDPPRIRRTGGAGAFEVEHTFTFDGQPLVVAVAIERDVLVGARAAPRSVRYRAGRRPPDMARLPLALVVDPELDGFFASLLGALRRLRERLQLDADGYCELLCAFVQGIPYDAAAEGLRFPIEVLADGKGDCDERSILLAGLLAREGFGCALLQFSGQRHMAVGLRADAGEFLGTGYTFVETTVPSLPGGRGLAQMELLASEEPGVVKVAAGTRAYGAMTALLSAYEVVDQAEARLARWDVELDVAQRRLDERSDALRRSERLLQWGAAAAAVDAHNAAIDDYNRAVLELGARLHERNDLAAVLQRARGDGVTRSAVLGQAIDLLDSEIRMLSR